MVDEDRPILHEDRPQSVSWLGSFGYFLKKFPENEKCHNLLNLEFIQAIEIVDKMASCTLFLGQIVSVFRYTTKVRIF